jgi:hypothetical protein
MRGMSPTKLPILSSTLFYFSLCHLAREGRKHSLQSLHLSHLWGCSRDFCLLAGQRPSGFPNGLLAGTSALPSLHRAAESRTGLDDRRDLVRQATTLPGSISETSPLKEGMAAYQKTLPHRS